MGKIKLHNQFYPEATAVSNYFIDKYMPAANGAFVKVYLYLLRHLSSNEEMSIDVIAEKLDETEKDIHRALTYWEKQNLLHIARNTEQSITDILILNLCNDIPSASALEAAASGSSLVNDPLLNREPFEGHAFSDNAAGDHGSDAASLYAHPPKTLPPDVHTSEQQAADRHLSGAHSSEKHQSAGQASEGSYMETHEDNEADSASLHSLKPNYSKAQIAALFEVEEIKWLVNTIEQYLERLLKNADIQLVLYLYEGLGFSAELILYLYEYCISMNKKSTHYIEAVAIAWSESGIDTVEKAEETAEIYNKNYQAVYKAFGLNRSLGSVEKQCINKWFHTYKLDKSVIEEALNRTLLAAGKPDFKYADKIITSWHKKNVKSLSDVKNLDEEHHKNTYQSQPKNKIESAASPNNRFNAFPQRNHDNEYYLSLEKHLLSGNGSTDMQQPGSGGDVLGN